ncbi:MAG: 5,6-dimethylbenzimidazole synthase [Bacillaceae bacterium]|uniref:5,6-dimethylbenzimidazole synthase n=1 Tax=Alkalihalobacterium chitinilyticum TaxID=2980103 RepID=A0ABT5VHE0_9BACI|nr:5,6-dimethylbenzimidazole synthase [Alkalihalobacterium chitinilyticum]MDE5414861.1 5,6-dimethylbenzimidazole synthase [Alkalihalobacterium chitinilyticum]MEB1805808.1 5,6-dimethylbenzimidazole synthase [Bacillaceae bacterium]
MYSDEQKKTLYDVIKRRRDVRTFKSEEVPEEAIMNIIQAGHDGPSVGFMQPWNFIIIQSQEVKEKLAWAANKEKRALAIHYEDKDEKHQKFLGLKVQGLKEAPITICVTCDPTRGGSHVLGRNSIPETDVMSTACAIQNMWLAATVEGLALGWVSFYKKNDIRDILNIPPHIDPIALLSIGYTDNYPEKPILEAEGWEKRRQLDGLIFAEKWGNKVE